MSGSRCVRLASRWRAATGSRRSIRPSASARRRSPSRGRDALGPVEAAGQPSVVGLGRRSGVLANSSGAGSSVARREEDHALAALGKAERSGVDDAVRPARTHRLELSRSGSASPRPRSSWSMNGTFSSSSHRAGRVSTSRKTSPTRPELPPAMPAVRPAWLRSWQGKPAGDEIDVGEAVEVADVAGRARCRGTSLEHVLSPVRSISHRSRVVVARRVQAQLDAADACEQSRNLHERPPCRRPRTYRGRADASPYQGYQSRRSDRRQMHSRQLREDSSSAVRPSGLLLSKTEC